MIDPTVLRQLVEEWNGYVGALDRREEDGLTVEAEQRLLSYLNTTGHRIVLHVPALLDENAALRAQREASDQRAEVAQDALGLERLEHQRTKDRLAALREAGNAVVEAVQRMAAPLSPAANRALADLDGLLLRSDP